MYHVANNGAIFSVVTQGDEDHGRVDIRYLDGKVERVSSLSLFTSEAGAKRAAETRSKTVVNSVVDTRKSGGGAHIVKG